MVSTTKRLTSAFERHQAGDFEQAERLYKQVLRVDPRHAEALHLLGVVSHQRHDHTGSVALIQKAIAENDRVAAYHCNLGSAQQALGDLKAALDSFQRAIDIDENSADAHYNRATLCKELGRTDEAIAGFERTLAINASLFEAYNNLGIIYQDREQLERSVEFYLKAAQTNPEFPEAFNNLGVVLHELDKPIEAEKCLRKAVHLREDYAAAHRNLGDVFRDENRFDEAAECYLRALQIDPEFVAAHVNLGLTRKEQGDLTAAIACNERALEIDPEFVEARINRAFIWRLTGDLDRGWQEYEWRWKAESLPERFDEPVWDGNPAPGKTLLIYAEQGVGDEVMFASCIPDVVEQVDNCIVECDARLVPLYSRSIRNVEFVARHDDASASHPSALPDFDLQIAIGSVPRFVRTSRESFPQREHYLVPDAKLAEKWRSRFAALGDGLKVGLSWHGGRRAETRRRRSTSLDIWRESLKTPNVQFVNLQYGDHRAEIETVKNNDGIIIHDWDDADPLKNLDDFAAQISALDLVISIDNSTVHIAGAIGVPVWTLLPFVPDWRWQMEGEQTLWYPNMRLIRQPELGDWQSVFARVRSALITVSDDPDQLSQPTIQFQNDAHQSETGSRCDADDQWLFENCSLRMDANKRHFPKIRRELHLSRYRFAKTYCAGKRVLDAACGTGYGSAVLAEAADEVYGVDKCGEAVAYANRTYGDRHVRFTESCVERTPFDENSFDVVASFETLEHIIAPRSALVEFVRVLRDDGTAVLSIPNAWGYTPHHFINFDFEMLRELTETCFEEQQFFYNNSGERPGKTRRGIGPLDDVSPSGAECIVAVCKRPRKEVVPADRLESLMEEIYENAFGRHRELLDLQKRSFEPGLNPETPEAQLPSVSPGADITLEAKGLTEEPGQVMVSLPVDVRQWSPLDVKVTLPNLQETVSRRAQVHLILPDGQVGVSQEIRIDPS